MGAMARRDFLALAAAASAATAGTSIWGAASEPTTRPNLLVILADDLGWGDLSCYGAKDLRTPNIDRLAAEGVRFEDFYANCPVCSPTRAALMTGCYPEAVGVPGVIRTHATNSWGHLRPDAVLLPSLLGRAGYTTALIGKWHLGLQSPNTPPERGFDYFHGFLGDMMDDYYTHRRHGFNYMRRNREEIDPEGHATDLFTQWACDFIQRSSLTQRRDPTVREGSPERAEQNGRPFFLYLAYNAPHAPIQPPAEWLEKVKQREPGISEKRAKLVALIEHMDAGIGRVLEALRAAGLESNTLVVFTSDNGGDLGPGANNGPWRAGKGTLYEGGIRVPMAARWPGRIAGGGRSSHIALTMDLMPTLCEVAGAAVGREIDGRSISPALLGRAQVDPARDLFWGRREGGAPFWGENVQAIRRGDWKLLRPTPNAPYELYNLKDDPFEKKDLAQAEPRVFRELAQALQAQLQRYGAVPWQDRPPAP
jgi:arylsulfatase A-like enzyme